MDAADTEGHASARAVSAAIEPFDDFFDAEGTRLTVALEIELEDQANGFSLHWVDIELLLDFGASLLGLHEFVAKRSHRSIPEPLPRVLLHRPDNVFGILFGLVFIE